MSSEDFLKKINKSLEEINESLKFLVAKKKAADDDQTLSLRSTSSTNTAENSSETKYTLADCMKTLDGLNNGYWTLDDDMIFHIPKILQGKGNKEIFMSMCGDHQRRQWIRGVMSQIKRG